MRGLVMLVLLGLPLAAGAQRVEETPRGEVPPAPAQRAADDLPGERPVMAQQGAATVDVDEVVRRFADAYAGQDSPRILVYFNRELSAQVREWVASERVAVEGQSREISDDGRTDRAGGLAISRQYANSDGGRVGPGERWMWEFEQTIADLLLDARVNLIDRAVVMRRQAAAADETLGNPQTSARALEMQALDQYADLLLELWVIRSDESPIGYELRAQLKDVEDGRLVATVTTWGDGLPGEDRRQVVASSSGYQFIDELPTVADAAEALGVELMETLIRRW